MYYHVNGDLVEADDATVSVRDRGFRYGDAAVETVRVYGGDLFEWDAHVDRLLETCELLAIDHGLDRAALRERIEATLDANDLADAAVRLSITRGVQPGTLTPSPEVDPTVVITVRGLPRGGLDGSETWAGPARVRTVETRRIPDEAIPSRAKTHNSLNGLLARLQLRGTDVEEALLCDGDGHLAEGATSNLFFVGDDALRTPSLEGPVLPGVTRSVVIDLAAAEGIPVEPGAYPPAALHAAEEAFLTSTTWEVRPIERVDGVPIGGGPVTDLLGRLFDELVEERHYEQRQAEDE